VALKVHEIQRELEYQGFGLKIWDAYRPLPIQHILWSHVPDERYVADPQKGSSHNRGAAIDLTLVDAQGRELPMPTLFDDFTERAHLAYEDLPQEILAHRELLISVMVRGGFTPIPTEWWHFNDNLAEHYSILSISFEELALQGPA
jgi:D-alanyl-D-alanine dipeptidase